MESRPWLTFSLDDTVYCLPVHQIREVTPWHRPEPVPSAPGIVEGIINLRGDIVTVVDGRALLGLAETEPGDDTRIMTLELPGETLGLTVDNVREIIDVDPAQIEPPPHAQPAILGTVQMDDMLVVALDTAYLSELSAGASE